MLKKSDFWILFISESLCLKPIFAAGTNRRSNLYYHDIKHYALWYDKTKTQTYHNVHWRYVEEPVQPLKRHWSMPRFITSCPESPAGSSEYCKDHKILESKATKRPHIVVTIDSINMRSSTHVVNFTDVLPTSDNVSDHVCCNDSKKGRQALDQVCRNISNSPTLRDHRRCKRAADLWITFSSDGTAPYIKMWPQGKGFLCWIWPCLWAQTITR